MSTYPERENPSASAVARQLREAGDSVRGGAFGEALEAIGHLRREMPKNIYCIGLEKQIQKLIFLPEGSEKREILSSVVPNLIERAIDEAHRTGRSRALKNQRRESTASGTRAVALERLVTQYFGHAERYFREGDYEKALVELRRVHIIDPDNRQAREFEEKLVRLIEGGQHEEQQTRHRDESTSSRKVEELLSKRDDVQPQNGFPAVPHDEEDIPATLPEQLPPKRGESRRQKDSPSAPHRDENASSKRLEDLLSKRDDPPPRGAEPHRQEQGEKTGSTPEDTIDEVIPSPENVISIPIITIVAVVAAFVVGYLLITANSKPKSVPITSTEITDLARSVAAPEPPPPQRDSKKVAEGPVVRDSGVGAVRGLVAPARAAVERDTAGSPRLSPPATVRNQSIETAPANQPQQQESQGAKLRQQEPPAVVAPSTPSAVIERDTTGFAAFRAASENLFRAPGITVLSEPTYPDSALKNGLAGQVIVFVQLDANGHPITAKIYKSSHPVFEIPARRAALRSQYSAGATERGPVPSWIVVPFLFRPQSSSLSREE
jgi:TonB family protein